MPPDRDQLLRPSDSDVLLAVVENAVRLASAAGAGDREIRESVDWALCTPETEGHNGS